MRGEHYRLVLPFHNNGGSSPHARGAPAVKLQMDLARGIIPACAGSTCLNVPPLSCAFELFASGFEEGILVTGNVSG